MLLRDVRSLTEAMWRPGIDFDVGLVTVVFVFFWLFFFFRLYLGSKMWASQSCPSSKRGVLLRVLGGRWSGLFVRMDSISVLMV